MHSVDTFHVPLMCVGLMVVVWYDYTGTMFLVYPQYQEHATTGCYGLGCAAMNARAWMTGQSGPCSSAATFSFQSKLPSTPKLAPQPGHCAFSYMSSSMR